MVTETESNADTSFRAGRFDEACAIYSNLLAGLDASNSSEKIELVRKLGDSQKGAGHYQEAISTYEQLRRLQTEYGSGGVETISTYLKLAKMHDLCKQRSEAEVEFKTAYKLAKSLLPPKHKLQRIVVGSYARWLVSTGGDSALLAILRNELKEMAEPGKEPDTSPSTQAVLVSRGESVMPLLSRDSLTPHHTEAAEQSAQSMPSEPAVADLLSQEIEAERQGSDWSPKDFDVIAEAEMASAGSITSASDFIGAAVPLSANKDDVATVSGTDWSNLPIRNQAAMRRSPRSYFKDGNTSTVGLDKALKDEQTGPNRFIKFIPLVICAVLFGLIVTSLVNEPPSKELPPVFRALVGKTFATADQSCSLYASSGGFSVTGHGLKKTIKPAIWKGSLSDELRLLRGEFNKCIWLSVVEHGLQDQTGLKFWDETSGNGRTMKAMFTVAAGAQAFYQNHRRYPTPAEAKSLFTYRNPFTDKIEPLSAYSTISYFMNAATRNERLENSLNSGQSFEREDSQKPGTVALLSIINKQNAHVEFSNQPVECQIAYIHAFDQNGQLIKCPTSDKALVIALVEGATIHPEDKTIVQRYSNATLSVAQGSPPSGAAVLFKYFGCILLVIGMVVYLSWVKQSASQDEIGY